MGHLIGMGANPPVCYNRHVFWFCLSEYSTVTLPHHGWRPLPRMELFACGQHLHGDVNIPLVDILQASMSFGGAAAV